MRATLNGHVGHKWPAGSPPCCIRWNPKLVAQCTPRSLTWLRGKVSSNDAVAANLQVRFLSRHDYIGVCVCVLGCFFVRVLFKYRAGHDCARSKVKRLQNVNFVINCEKDHFD